MQERRLSRSAWAHDRDELAGTDAERDIIKRDNSPLSRAEELSRSVDVQDYHQLLRSECDAGSTAICAAGSRAPGGPDVPELVRCRGSTRAAASLASHMSSHRASDSAWNTNASSISSHARSPSASA